MADEWMIVSASGEYYITGNSCLHALATFVAEHPDDPIYAICVQGAFKDGFRWQLKYHETDWRCPECGWENGHADTCQTGRTQHDEAFGGPELRAAEKFELDNPHPDQTGYEHRFYD